MDNLQEIPAKTTLLLSAAGRYAGLLLGALAGIIEGIPGVFIGASLGALLQQLILRCRAGRKAARYFEAPGKVDFNEGLPGLSAYCALGTILASLSVRAAEPKPLFRQGSAEEDRGGGAPPGKSREREFIARRVIQSALEAFPGSFPPFALMEDFCRIALSMTDRLNPDLLAESLAARRSAVGDIERLGRELESLAEGDRALQEAASIHRILTQAYRRPLNKEGNQEVR
ncbi:MAG: hypothetical protein LBU16_02705 [Treponema sp.]|jgi:DnaJ like chaperone protein|nr:hypothetical protein [Treponema sp.]